MIFKDLNDTHHLFKDFLRHMCDFKYYYSPCEHCAIPFVDARHRGVSKATPF